MTLGVLTFQSRQYQNFEHVQLLVDAAARANIDTTIIDTASLTLSAKNGIHMRLNGKPLPSFDAILVRPRIQGDPSIPVSILRALEATGVPLINTPDAILAGKNKVESHIRLAAAGVSTITTEIAYSVDDVARAAKRLRYPIVLKVPYGSHGTGVFTAADEETLRPIADFLISRGYNDPILVQPRVKNISHDVRAFVIGRKVVAAAERQISKGDFRSNQKQGAVMRPYTLTKAQEKIALAAAKATKIDVAGVDLLISGRKCLVVEVNANPQFKAITEATGTDVAGAIIRYAKRKARTR